MRLFGVCVSNCNHCCWSRWGKTLIYDPIWTHLRQRAFCVPLLASRVWAAHHLCSRLSVLHPLFFNDRMQWSVQRQRSSLNNIITWPAKRDDENRYQLHIELLASVVSPWNCSCSGQTVFVIELIQSIRVQSLFLLILSVVSLVSHPRRRYLHSHQRGHFGSTTTLVPV